MRKRIPAVVVAMASTCALLVGCTTDSGVNTQTLEPTTPATSAERSDRPTPPVSQSPTSPGFSSSPVTEVNGGLSAQETADRADIEAQWTKLWEIYAALPHTPMDQRAALVATVAVDPTLTNLLTDADTLNAKGWDTYGQIAHRITWPEAVDSKSSAVIADCQDSSQSGSYETSSGNKQTVGVPRDHLQGALSRGDDGVWRVNQIFYLKDEPC